ncbi:MAG: hypothetical protein ACXWMN_05875, partial [Candidatus Limnocylindria bacterium]
VLTSVEGSIQLAESMESRGFGSGSRTSMRTLRLTAADWWLVGGSVVAVLGFIASQVFGWVADWAPYPTLTAPDIDARPLLACLFLFSPVVLWRSRA